MVALRVVEHLDIIGHVLPCFFARPVGSAPDPLAFEQVEKALGDCVIMAIATTAYGVFKVVGAQERSLIHAGELAALDTLLRVKR